MNQLRRVILCLALGAQAFVRPAQRLTFSRRAPALHKAVSMSLAGTKPLKVAIVGATGAKRLHDVTSATSLPDGVLVSLLEPIADLCRGS